MEFNFHDYFVLGVNALGLGALVWGWRRKPLPPAEGAMREWRESSAQGLRRNIILGVSLVMFLAGLFVGMTLAGDFQPTLFHYGMLMWFVILTLIWKVALMRIEQSLAPTSQSRTA